MKQVSIVRFMFQEKDTRGAAIQIMVTPSDVNKIILNCKYLRYVLYKHETAIEYNIVHVIPAEWTADNYELFSGFLKGVYPFTENPKERIDVSDQIKTWYEKRYPNDAILTKMRRGEWYPSHEVDHADPDLTAEDRMALYIIFQVRHRMIRLRRYLLRLDECDDVFTVTVKRMAGMLFQEPTPVFKILPYTDPKTNKTMNQFTFTWIAQLNLAPIGSVLLDDFLITRNPDDMIPFIPPSPTMSYHRILKVLNAVELKRALDERGIQDTILFVTDLETDPFPDWYYTDFAVHNKLIVKITIKCIYDVVGILRKDHVYSAHSDLNPDGLTLNVWYSDKHYPFQIKDILSKSIVAHTLKPSHLLKEVGIGYKAVVGLGRNPLLFERMKYVVDIHAKNDLKNVPMMVVSNPYILRNL